jgi:hypothetical protein
MPSCLQLMSLLVSQGLSKISFKTEMSCFAFLTIHMPLIYEKILVAGCIFNALSRLFHWCKVMLMQLHAQRQTSLHNGLIRFRANQCTVFSLQPLYGPNKLFNF